MKKFKKILLFILVLCMFPPASFSQEERNTTNTEWILNPASSRGLDSNTRTFKNSDGSRVFVNSGIPDTGFTAGILAISWRRTFSPNLEVPYKISAEFKLESGINLDSVETFLTLEDSLGNWHFFGAQRQPLLNSQWQTLIWDVEKYENNSQYKLVSVKVLQFNFQNRSRASYVRSVIYVRNIKKINVDGSFSIIDLITGISELEETPSQFVLFQNYPNPFNPTTKISFSIPESGDYKLEVYNILGQKVATLIDAYLAPGIQEYSFSGANLPSGTYFYRLTGKNISLSNKMILMK